MAQRLKRWESPRRAGRNDKGRGGSARQRQKRKQLQALRQKLKSDSGSATDRSNPIDQHHQHPGEAAKLPFFNGDFLQSNGLKHRRALILRQKLQIAAA